MVTSLNAPSSQILTNFKFKRAKGEKKFQRKVIIYHLFILLQNNIYKTKTETFCKFICLNTFFLKDLKLCISGCVEREKLYIFFI